MATKVAQYNPSLDDSPNDLVGSYHGTYQGGMGTVANTTYEGVRAYSFVKANSQHISLPEGSQNLVGTFPFAVSGWINPASTPNFNTVVYNREPGGSYPFLIRFFGNKLQLVVNNSIILTGTTTIPTNTWTHFSLVFASTTDCKLHINGRLDASLTSVPGVTYYANAPLLIGSIYDGLIDNLTFWSGVPTQAEIQKDYFSRPGTRSLPTPMDGQVGWWDPTLDVPSRGTTRLFDLSGGGNHGTLTNMDAATDWIDGPHGKVLDYDGIDDRVVVPHHGDLSAGVGKTLTASMHVYTKNIQLSGIISKLSGSYGFNGWYISTYADGRIEPALRGNIANQPSVAAGVLKTNTWQHFVIEARVGVRLKLWVDSVLVVDVPDTSTSYSESNGLWLGFGYQGASRATNSIITDTRIFNRVITTAEIAALAAAPGYQPGGMPRINGGLINHSLINRGRIL